MGQLIDTGSGTVASTVASIPVSSHARTCRVALRLAAGSSSVAVCMDIQWLPEVRRLSEVGDLFA